MRATCTWSEVQRIKHGQVGKETSVFYGSAVGHSEQAIASSCSATADGNVPFVHRLYTLVYPQAREALIADALPPFRHVFSLCSLSLSSHLPQSPANHTRFFIARPVFAASCVVAANSIRMNGPYHTACVSCHVIQHTAARCASSIDDSRVHRCLLSSSSLSSQAEGAVLLPHGARRAAAVDPLGTGRSGPANGRRFIPGGGHRGRAGE